MHKRFTKQYVEDRVAVDSNGCWIWKNSKHGFGYGQLGIKPYTAHVLSFMLWKGEPNGLVRHLCNVPACCNPEHLADGTHRDNWYDSEESHREAARRRRGRPAANRQRVLFRGVVFESKAMAVKTMRVTWRTVTREGKLLG